MSAKEEFRALSLPTGPERQYQSHGISSGIAVQITILLVSWLITYNAAYVNGDDVYHLQGEYGNSIYFPDLGSDWIPNRVFDLYGRSLIVHFSILFISR